jgi:broad specificity phosphatase PhoE
MTWMYARHAQPEKEYADIDVTLENESLGLGPDGIEQSLMLAHRSSVFQVILHSPFERAKQTAQTLHSAQGGTSQLISVPELAEVKFGHPTKMHLKEWITTGKSEEGETVAMARERVRAVKEFARTFGPVNGLIVSHKLLYSVFLLDKENLPTDTPVAKLLANKKLEYAQCVELPF